jgi:phage terminase small subunit
MTDKDKKLTSKQEKFVAAFLKSFNATEAARIAGYAHARQAGAECMAKPDIKARINEHLDQIRDDGIGNRANRLAQLNSLNDDLMSIQTARAQEAQERLDNGEVLPAGSETGLLIETKKQIGKVTEVVWNIDTTLVKERQSILEQAAREVGDRDKRLVELSGPDGGPVRIENAKTKLLELVGGDDG